MGAFPSFFNDTTIRFDHTPVIAKFAFQMNHVGAHDSDTIDVATFTYTDVNSIFVSDTVGNDTTGTGTQALPYKTILKGINSTTALLTYVIVLDSVLYAEDISPATTTYFQGLYAATGQTPTFTTRLLGFVPADANTIFFDKTGSDGDAGTQAAPKLTIAGAVAATDGTHQAIVCQDSETYTEAAIEMTGNFLGMYAALGEKPTYIPTATYDSSDYTDIIEVIEPVDFDSNAGGGHRSATFANGSIITVWLKGSSPFTGEYVIHDEDGSKFTSGTFSSNSVSNVDVDALASGEAVITYIDKTNSDEIYFLTINNLGVGTTPASLISGAAVTASCVCGLTGGNFAIFYEQGTNGIFAICTPVGVIDSTNTIETSAIGVPRIAGLNNGSFVACYTDGTTAYGTFSIVDSAGNITVAATTFDTDWPFRLDVAVLNNDNWVCVFENNTTPNNQIEYLIRQEDGTAVTTGVLDSGDNVNPTVAVLNNGSWVTTFQNAVSGGVFIVRQQDGSAEVAKTVYESGNQTNSDVAVNGLGNFQIVYVKATSSYGRMCIWYPYSWTGLKISDASTINGFVFDGNDFNQLNKLIETNGAKPTLKWLDIKNATNPSTTLVNGYGVYGDNETDLYNSKIYSNDGGIYLTANVDDCIIKDNHFYFNNKTWAIRIDGAAAISGDITVEHNDIFQNFEGVYFENNTNGLEVLKNNNIHNNSNEGAKADVLLTMTYTVRTDDSDNVSDGTSVLFSNPLYVNEGAISGIPDLNVKTIITGYPTDSPAKGQADDSRNTGAYDVRYIGSATTWTSITIDKPGHGDFGLSYNPVGANLSIGRDGTPEFNKEGQTADLELKYDGMKNADYALVLAMWMSDESTVRVYPDPVTNANTYETMTMIRVRLQASASNYKLTRSGVQGVVLPFKRKFEL